MELFIEGVVEDPEENLKARLVILLALAQWVTDAPDFTTAARAMMEVAEESDAAL